MSNHDDALIENIWHELKAIREGYESLVHVPRKLTSIDERLGRVELDLKAIRAVAKDHSDLLSDHTRKLLGQDARLATLERTAP